MGVKIRRIGCCGEGANRALARVPDAVFDPEIVAAANAFFFNDARIACAIRSEVSLP